MIDCAQRARSNLKAETPSEALARERYVVQVWQKTPTRAVLRVADIVTGQNAFTGKLTTTGHIERPQTNESLRQ